VVNDAKRNVIQSDGSIKLENDIHVYAHGTNLYEVLLNPYVDQNRVITSSIGDTFSVLGVEAARSKIISETKVFTANCDHAHVSIYSDEMTRTGVYTSFERGGLAKREYSNALLRMAYGGPVQVATTSALMHLTNPVYGMAARQQLGDVPKLGTMYNSAVVNDDFVEKHHTPMGDLFDDLLA
jgi:hypothetical protein